MNRIQKIQNSCCRYTCGLRRCDHVTASINQLGGLKVHNLYIYSFSNLLFTVLQTFCPVYLSDKLAFRDDIYNRTTRHKQMLSIPRHRTTMFQRSFSYQSAKLYNAYRHFMSPCHDINKKLKEHILQTQST
nr:unnamed protein product [Callosobruchus analis]